MHRSAFSYSVIHSVCLTEPSYCCYRLFIQEPWARGAGGSSLIGELTVSGPPDGDVLSGWGLLGGGIFRQELSVGECLQWKMLHKDVVQAVFPEQSRVNSTRPQLLLNIKVYLLFLFL